MLMYVILRKNLGLIIAPANEKSTAEYTLAPVETHYSICHTFREKGRMHDILECQRRKRNKCGDVLNGMLMTYQTFQVLPIFST